MIEQIIITRQANQIIKTLGIVEDVRDLQHLLPIIDLGDLGVEILQVLGIKRKQNCFDLFDFSGDFFGRLEEIGIVSHFISQFRLEFIEVRFVCFVKLLPDVYKIHHEPVFEVFVGSVDPGKHLQKVVRFHLSAHIEFLQSLRIKSCQEHVVDKEEINFSVFESGHFRFSLFFGIDIMEDKCGRFDFTFLNLFIDERETALCRIPKIFNFRGSIDILKDLEHHLCLLGRIANDHRPNGIILHSDSGLLKILDDVIEHGLHEFGMSKEVFLLGISAKDLYFIQYFLECCLVAGGDFFPNQAQRIAVLNGRIVVVLVNVISEQSSGIVISAEQRGACQSDFNGILIGIFQVGQEASLRIIASMHFIEEENPLNIQLIIRLADHIRIVFEFLDIDNGDFSFPGTIVNCAGGSDIPCKFIFGINFMHH